MTYEERLDDMLQRYGEVCKRTQAARILGCSLPTVNAMLDDGRLAWACAGTMVDVRSIAAYICQPEQMKEKARKQRVCTRYGSRWAV